MNHFKKYVEAHTCTRLTLLFINPNRISNLYGDYKVIDGVEYHNVNDFLVFKNKVIAHLK